MSSSATKCGFLAALNQIESSADSIVDNGPLHEMSGSEFIGYAAKQVALATTESRELAAARLSALKATIATVKAQGFTGDGSVFIHLYDDSDRELAAIERALTDVAKAVKSLTGRLTTRAESSRAAKNRPNWSAIDQDSEDEFEPEAVSRSGSSRGSVSNRTVDSSGGYFAEGYDEDGAEAPARKSGRDLSVSDDEDSDQEAEPEPPRRATRQGVARKGNIGTAAIRNRARNLLANSASGLHGDADTRATREPREARSKGSLSKRSRMSEDDRTDVPEFSSRLWDRIDN